MSERNPQKSTKIYSTFLHPNSWHLTGNIYEKSETKTAMNIAQILLYPPKFAPWQDEYDMEFKELGWVVSFFFVLSGGVMSQNNS